MVSQSGIGISEGVLVPCNQIPSGSNSRCELTKKLTNRKNVININGTHTMCIALFALNYHIISIQRDNL